MWSYKRSNFGGTSDQNLEVQAIPRPSEYPSCPHQRIVGYGYGPLSMKTRRIEDPSPLDGFGPSFPAQCQHPHHPLELVAGVAAPRSPPTPASSPSHSTCPKCSLSLPCNPKAFNGNYGGPSSTKQVKAQHPGKPQDLGGNHTGRILN